MITVSSLDDFNRADERLTGTWPNGSPTKNWSTENEAETTDFMDIVSNNVVGAPAANAWWNPAQYLDVEMQLGLDGWAFDKVCRLAARLRIDPFSATPFRNMTIGYLAAFVGSDASILKRVPFPGGTSTLDSVSGNVMDSTGAAVALRCVGSEITLLSKPTASSAWGTLLTVTDTTFTDTGYVGFGLGSGISATDSHVGIDDGEPVPTVSMAAWGVLSA